MSDPAFPKNRFPRLASWWTVAVVLSLVVLFFAPAQLPVTLYKLNLIALAAVAGYWIDRSIFPYARPNIDALRLIEPVDDALPVAQQYSEVGDAEQLELQGRFLAPLYGELYYFAATQIRRALIVAATILAVSLGA